VNLVATGEPASPDTTPACEMSGSAGGAYVPTVFVGMYAPFDRCRHTILSMAKTEASFQK
jgi:hypothetical protein